jgi:hypothetical protein
MFICRRSLLCVSSAAAIWGAAVPASCAQSQSADLAGAAWVSTCPASVTEASPLTAERVVQWQQRSVVLRACWIGGQGGQDDQLVLELQPAGQPVVRALVPTRQELEGQLDDVVFDDARFALSEGEKHGLTIALRLTSHNRGAIIDDRFVNLWLYQFDGQRLTRVFAMVSDESHDPRTCSGTCEPPARSHAILIVKPGVGHHGLRDLRLREKTWTEGPNGKPIGGTPTWREQLFVFDGAKYLSRH